MVDFIWVGIDITELMEDKGNNKNSVHLSSLPSLKHLHAV